MNLKTKIAKRTVWHAANQRWMKHATENEKNEKKKSTNNDEFFLFHTHLNYGMTLNYTRQALIVYINENICRRNETEKSDRCMCVCVVENEEMK